MLADILVIPILILGLGMLIGLLLYQWLWLIIAIPLAITWIIIHWLLKQVKPTF